MRKLLNLTAVLISLSAALFGQDTFEYYSPQLKEAVEKVYKLPAAKLLIEQAQEDGPIQLIYAIELHVPANALWDPIHRRIMINAKRQKDADKIIHSIIFELQNASTSKALISLTDKAARKEISKKDYIEAIERIEHGNALRTKHLLQEGIALGIFPQSAYWNVPEHFEDHLFMQQNTGHSEWIAKAYDKLSSPSY